MTAEEIRIQDDPWHRSALAVLVGMPLAGILNSFDLGPVRPIDLAFILAMVTTTLAVLAPPVPTRSRLTTFLVIWGAAVLVAASTLGAEIGTPHFAAGWASTIRFLELVLWAGIATIAVRSRDDLEWLVFSVAAAGAVWGASALGIFVSNPSAHRVAGFVSVGTAESGLNPTAQFSFNEIGAVHALAALISVAVLLRVSTARETGSRSSAWTWGALLLLNVVGLVLTQSRSAVLAFGVGVTTFILWSPTRGLRPFRNWSLRKITGLVAVIMAAAVLIQLVLPINRIMGTLDLGSHAWQVAALRFTTWTDALSAWTTDIRIFFLGLGPAAYGDVVPGATSENFFLDRAISGGLIAVVISTALLLAAPVAVIRRCISPFATAVAVVSLEVALVVSLTGNVLADPFYGAATFALLYASLSVTQEQSEPTTG